MQSAVTDEMVQAIRGWMTLLKSSLFVICAGGERIMRSRIIVEAVTRVIIHYVFLDVVGGVYRMISQNGHQEEDQEGIRLRNNNVVHFVSDGYSSSSNNNSKRADDDGDGVTEKMSRYDRLLLIFGLALLTAVIIFQTMAWAVVWAQTPDDSQVISVGSSRAPELETEEDGSDGDGDGVLLVTVDEQEMPEWVVGSPSFLRFYLEKEYDGNVTLQKPIERVVNPLSLIPDEELTNEQEDVLEGLNNWLLASFVINSEEGSGRRETALFAYQDPSDEKSTTDGQGIVLHNLEGLI
jgi:hypothetical protein